MRFSRCQSCIAATALCEHSPRICGAHPREETSKTLQTETMLGSLGRVVQRAAALAELERLIGLEVAQRRIRLAEFFVGFDPLRHGTCRSGVCVCALGWGGDGCSVPQTNQCTDAECGWPRGTCNPRYVNAIADSTALAPAGLGAGGANEPKCACLPGWTGADALCSQIACPADCSGQGRCGHDGVCVCGGGWSGVDCSVPPCPQASSGPGLGRTPCASHSSRTLRR